MRFAWSKEYSVGSKEIDVQHKRFFGIINAVFELLDNGVMDEAELKKIVSELNDYAIFHFGTEEKYFAEFGCRGMEGHVKAHNAFRRKMKDLVAQSQIETDREGRERLAEEIANYALKWLCDHILIEDKKYQPCFAEHNLSR